MEKYIEYLISKKCREYINYAENIINYINKNDIEPLQSKRWREFFIEDIFKIFSGKRLTKGNMQNGNIPFLGASEANNGITQFVSNKNESYDKNVLGVNYNGSVGEAFYHSYGCIFSDDVKRFHLINYPDNKFVLLFLSLMLKKQKEKYSYGYKFNETRMLRQYILLPVNDKNEPDYEYMEKYIQNKMLQKYNAYLSYFKNLK
ncbi:MAG: restriction endonuclease subunit S [Alphaproteobacteria bacterium]|nr:restriction endonuclease subunit S [Alphaproteobacteria bacterium]